MRWAMVVMLLVAAAAKADTPPTEAERVAATAAQVTVINAIRAAYNQMIMEAIQKRQQ